MLRRMIFATVTIIFVLACCFIAFAKSAEKVNSVIFYGAKSENMVLFDIDGKKCVSIKDMAVILSGSSGQFNFKFDNDKFVIEKGRKYLGEPKFLRIEENTAGYTEKSMIFNMGNKSFQGVVYIIDNEYFINPEDLGKIIGFDVYYNSDDEMYINKRAEEIVSVLSDERIFDSAELIFENEYINVIREKIKQAFISAYGEENFTDAVKEKLNSDELCHDFKFSGENLKLKIYTRDISIPYSSVSRYIRRDIGNYAVITDFGSKKFDEFFVSAIKINNYTSEVSGENAEAKRTMKEIDKNRPVIALTFDDGPKRETTERLLDILEKYDARATFFVVGSRAEKNKDILKRAYDLNCQIGNHSYSHSMLTKLTLDEAKTEINKTSNIVFEATGDYARVGRPPYGSLNHEIKEASKIDWFNWALDTYDWKTRDSDTIYKRIMENAENGDIILMHDLYDTTVEAVERVVPELAEKGYQFVTVKELIDIKGSPDKISGYIRK